MNEPGSVALAMFGLVNVRLSPVTALRSEEGLTLASARLERAYRARLLARPSFARAVEEARPFRPLFPLGAPDRD
jgi:hypothetical protein